MGYKRLKNFGVVSLMLASLTACAANDGGEHAANSPGTAMNDTQMANNYQGEYTDPIRNNRDGGNYDYRLIRYRENPYNENVRDNLSNKINNRNAQSSGNNRNNLTSMNVGNNDQGENDAKINRFATTEIQYLNNGFITIDQNSYSTTTPSSNFPHSRKIKQGQYWYYSLEPGNNQNQPEMIIPKRPQSGIVTPPTNRQTAPAPTAPSVEAPIGLSHMALQVIELTNNERKKNGLAPLKADAALSKVAQAKSDDMEAKHYFAHTSPTYGSPFDMMRDFGVTYTSAGENIAMGQTTAQEVVTAWMNSEGHRKNILSPNFTTIGVGFQSKGNYWTQMFISK